jgi:hypothetical protein
LAGVAIAGPDGRPASWSAFTLALLFAMCGPLNWLDLIWLAGDPHRPTLRDKRPVSRVLRQRQKPIGGRAGRRHSPGESCTGLSEAMSKDGV